MLYSYNDSTIDRMAVGSRYWPADLTNRYAEIKSLQDQKKKPFQVWADKGSKRQEQTGFTPATGDQRKMTDQESLMKMYQRRYEGGGQ